MSIKTEYLDPFGNNYAPNNMYFPRNLGVLYFGEFYMYVLGPLIICLAGGTPFRNA